MRGLSLVLCGDKKGSIPQQWTRESPIDFITVNARVVRALVGQTG